MNKKEKFFFFKKNFLLVNFNINIILKMLFIALNDKISIFRVKTQFVNIYLHKNYYDN